ncbi:hypothetical protein AAC387_Pa07g2884 [Persea americana]
MPREPDIGWQHGTMVGGHRHHVQCNYCHRKMIGGVTRFKKHLAGKRGEIKGCDAVPNEVREIIRKHLAAAKPRKTSSRKKAKVHMEPMNMSTFDGKDTESDESDREMAAARLESLRILHEECKSDNQQLIAGSREFFDAFSNVPCKDEQGLAPSRATDLGWAHGMMVNGDRQKIKCKYCHRVILGGGISRLKQHLAGERGNIAPCEEVPEDVKGLMQQHLGFKVLERLKRQKESEDGKGLFHEGEDANTDDMQRRANADLASNINGKRRRKAMDDGSSSRRRRSRKSFIATAPPIHQPMMHLAFASQESMDQADIAVAKFMIHKGLLDCIETLEPSLNCQDTITQHKTYYEEAVGDFSRPVAIRGRESLSPATWWSLYASDYPELQRFAIRILSQTCSGIRCERNWSMFERIHASKRNRLEQKRLNDLLFIHYNLRLQQRQTGTLGSKILMSGAHDPTCLEGMNADAGDWVEDLGALEGEGTDWMDGSPFIDFAVASAKISNVNNHNDSIDDGCSDDSNENNGSEDS